MNVITTTFDLDLVEPVSASEIDDALSGLGDPEPHSPANDCQSSEEPAPLPPSPLEDVVELGDEDILESLPPLEDVWAGCADTVKHDYEEIDAQGIARVVHEYLSLEKRGVFDDLPGDDPQRVIRQLTTDFDSN
jgi:hypothetical protein